MQHHTIQLGVNVDHIATLRQARGVSYPDPTQGADIARRAGADGVTVHLREDRRHIQERDVLNIKEYVALPLNLEMAATEEMLQFALRVQPIECCLVPEKREELTTEGGLDVALNQAALSHYVTTLQQAGIRVSLFIDPDPVQLQASQKLGADIVELHTGSYAQASADSELQARELARLAEAAEIGRSLDLQINAGHGLHYQNVAAVAALAPIVCLNIGHAVISRAVLSGLHEAVFTMKELMIGARLAAEGVTTE